MSGRAPFFLTGANARITVNGVTMAYATDVSYRIEVKHAAPRVLGMYEPVELAPLEYNVQGSFSIVRYVRGMTSCVDVQAPGTSDSGNGLGSWTLIDNPYLAALGLPPKGGLAEGKANENLNPGRLYQAIRWDLWIWQKTEIGDLPVARIRDCRIEVCDFKMSKRSPGTETYTFKALYADTDSFFADTSGVGQKWM